MGFLSNPEVRFPLLGMLAAAGLSLGVLAAVFKETAYVGAVLWAVGGAFALCCAIFLTASALHSKKVQRLTDKVEHNLHGSRDLQFDEFREGDFSYLEGAVKKMAISHARKEEQLTEEKGLLKDSLENIMHQIRTPLQFLTSAADQLMEDEVLPSVRKRASRKIQDTVEHISGLVEILLKLARLDAGAVTFRTDTFTAAELIEQICMPLEPIMDLREIALVKNIPPEITLHSDMIFLKEALLNIVKNCMEHTPPGGTVSIDVSENPVWIRFEICDTGPGIAEEDLPHLFERFYRGKDAGANSVGIGLSFTNQVIHALGGRVDPQNRPEGGAMFTVQMKTDEKMNI